MHFTKKNSSEKRIELKNKLKDKKILRFPGAYNPLTAKLITEIGFDGIYISGGVMSNDLGMPDIGLTTLKEVSYRANQISRVSDLPSIVDADTGFKNCKKTIETFENLGLSGCHIEDQIEEKRCGHLDNKEIISNEDMEKKIKTCVDSRKDKNFLIIARTDANTVEGLDKTIERIKNNLNPELSIRGILLTMYDRRNKLSGEVEKEARDYFKDKVYQTVVPRNVRLSEAPSHGMPVLFYDKSCPGSKSYFSFTDEFINQEKIMESAA